MFFKEIAKVLSEIEEDISREIYIDRISKKYNISKDAIYSDVKKLDKKKAERLQKEVEKELEKKQEIEEKDKKVLEIDTKREEYLIYILLENISNEKIKKEIQDNIDLNNISLGIHKKIFEYILNNKFTNKDIAISNIEDDDIRNKIAEIYSKDIKIDQNILKQSIKDILKQFELNELKQEREQILKDLKDTTLKPEERKQKENRLNEILKKMIK